jgi:competence protein ComEA
MPSRSAFLALALATLLPTAWRAWASFPASPRTCAPEGRGTDDRTWVGCAADAGPRRELRGRERIAFGVPVSLNEATSEDLAAVPGFTARLAREVVADRRRNGRFPSVESLLRVHGLGPRRLESARAHLVVE